MAAPTLHHVTWAETYPAQQLVPYDPEWVTRYAELADSLTAALGPGWDVEHVGSTSVPGLTAKPVIDLAVRQPSGRDIAAAVGNLRDAGWTEPVAVGNHRAVFMLEASVRVAVAHVFTHDQWECAHVRLFAGWLRSHAAVRDEYQRLKLRLVSDGVWGSEYTRGKAEFVTDVVNRARAERGLPAVHVL